MTLFLRGGIVGKTKPLIFAMDGSTASYFGVGKNVAKAFSVGKEIKKEIDE